MCLCQFPANNKPDVVYTHSIQRQLGLVYQNYSETPFSTFATAAGENLMLYLWILQSAALPASLRLDKEEI